MPIRQFVSIAAGVFVVTVLSIAVGLIVSIEPTMAQTQEAQEQQFAVRGADTCLTCHNNPTVTSVFDTRHGNSSIPNSPFAGRDCESCHGASPDHVSTMQSPAVVFGAGAGRFTASDIQVQNQACLSCHETGDRVLWTASVHETADVACVSCHTIHAGPNTASSLLPDLDTCLSCHLEKRSQLNRRSHHPLSEGLMTCSDCHSPHGSNAESLLAKSTVNETCETCHAEKRGPFLWEHQPVSEDCTTCHNPHGTTQASMLSVRQPFLCQGCHSEAYHPSTLYSEHDIPPLGAAQQLLGTSCTNCHSAVHGSNHPSGSRLTR